MFPLCKSARYACASFLSRDSSGLFGITVTLWLFSLSISNFSLNSAACALIWANNSGLSPR